jgi:hypothetical protein
MYSPHLKTPYHSRNTQSPLQNGFCTSRLVYTLYTRFQFIHLCVSINFNPNDNIKMNRFLLEYTRTYLLFRKKLLYKLKYLYTSAQRTVKSLYKLFYMKAEE